MNNVNEIKIYNAREIAGKIIEDLYIDTNERILMGYEELDKQIRFKKSDVMLIAARPGMGKFNFALNIALNLAVKEKKIVTIFDMEKSKEKVCMYMMSNLAEISISKFLRSDSSLLLETEKIKTLDGQALERIYIDDTLGISIEEVFSKFKLLKKEKNVDLIIIDYVQLIASEKKRKNRDIMKQLKMLAKELDIAIIVLSNLSNNVDRREDKRPKLTDFNDMEILKFTDIVLFLYCNSYYEEKASNEEIMEVIIAKNKYDSTGICKLKNLKEYIKFEEYR